MASSIRFLPVNGACLVFNENFSNTVKDYYDYITMLLYKVLEKNPQLHLFVIFENLQLKAISAADKRPKIYVYLNVEHTLVRPGGRNLENAARGNIPVVGVGEGRGEHYMVRIDKYPLLQQKHIVIEYSNPNIDNCATCSAVPPDFVNKMVYIAPLIYEPQFSGAAAQPSQQQRTISCLTTFINTKEPRRAALLNRAGSRILNVNNCFNRYELQRLYGKTKVMINIHQTDHHHTFEELRVLPALCCGVIVVCERSPLIEKVPYHEYVIWADYDDVLEKAQEVLDNYEECYNLIFGGDKLRNLMAQMETDNYNRLVDRFSEVAVAATAH